MNSEEKLWDKIYSKMGETPPKIDDWLEKYMPLIKRSKSAPIIDLGCGFGNDTLYLTQKGYDVISCDYSKPALERLKHFISCPKCKCLDMRKKLPFETNSADIIICDLSLHYFDEETTFSIISEIKRVLTSKGALICRVNSVKEIQNEEHTPQRIEHNFYLVGKKKKRYFTKDDVNKYFCSFKISEIFEYEMLRYDKPKFVLDFAALNEDF